MYAFIVLLSLTPDPKDEGLAHETIRAQSSYHTDIQLILTISLTNGRS